LEVLKDEIIKAVNDFHTQRTWPIRCNVTFITLVPKIENPQELKEYRSIFLVGCLYKIISKLLALPSVIDKTQSTFLVIF